MTVIPNLFQNLPNTMQNPCSKKIIAEHNKKLLEETKKNHTDLQISTKSADAKIDSRSKSQISVTKGYISSYIFKEEQK